MTPTDSSILWMLKKPCYSKWIEQTSQAETSCYFFPIPHEIIRFLPTISPKGLWRLLNSAASWRRNHCPYESQSILPGPCQLQLPFSRISTTTHSHCSNLCDSDTMPLMSVLSFVYLWGKQSFSWSKSSHWHLDISELATFPKMWCREIVTKINRLFTCN